MTTKDEQSRLRSALEVTRLGFALTADDVTRVTRFAVEERVGGICIPTVFLSQVSEELKGAGSHRPDLVTVLNFPLGDHDDGHVRRDAAGAARAGADHLDLVVAGRYVAEGSWPALVDFLRGAREAAEDVAGENIRLKVILETAALTEDQIRRAAEAAITAGAGWLKTSTGFHPRGGATVEAVRLLRSLAPAEVGVKASGGIRTRADAMAMIEAGADRLGTSSEQAIL